MAFSSTDLTNVETAISARLSGGAVERYSIDGRSLQYMAMKDLLALRREIQRELNASTTIRTKVSIRYAAEP